MSFEYHKETEEEKIYNRKKSMALQESLYFFHDILPLKADYILQALNISIPYAQTEEQPLYVLCAWMYCTLITREEFRNKSVPYVTICPKNKSPFEYPDTYCIMTKEDNYKEFQQMLKSGRSCNPFFSQEDVLNLQLLCKSQNIGYTNSESKQTIEFDEEERDL